MTASGTRRGTPPKMFQPFLRFYARSWLLLLARVEDAVSTLLEILQNGKSAVEQARQRLLVSTLLEILPQAARALRRAGGVGPFQPFLRFYPASACRIALTAEQFQPFLRFYRSRHVSSGAFKLFAHFLRSRRSLSGRALRSFSTALGRAGTPFFGAPRE